MKFYLINFITMVSEVFLKLFSSFLHNIMQCTKIGAFKSSYKRMSCGVPLGSVISPLLFLIYINDITNASSFHTTLFADDKKLHMSNSCFNVLQTTVNLELCKIDHWLRANKLSLNYSKTNFMLLTSRKHSPASFKVPINNHNISPEDNLKYLCVLLDNKLSWKPHVQMVKTHLSRACGILSKLKHYTTPPVLKVVCNSLIHPYLYYSILNWGRASNATIQPLIKLQNKLIKIINLTNMGSLEEHFQHLNILCLPKLYSVSVGKFMHSYHKKLLPNHFEYFIPLSSIHYHSTRLATSNNLFLPRANSSSGKCSLKFIGQKVWSSIPDDIKFSTAFTFNGNLRNTSYMKKIPNFELKQHFTCLEQNTVYSVTLFYFLCAFTFSHFLCAYSMLSGMKYTFCFFLFCFVFFCTSLITFCNLFTFLLLLFDLFVLLKIL